MYTPIENEGQSKAGPTNTSRSPDVNAPPKKDTYHPMACQTHTEDAGTKKALIKKGSLPKAAFTHTSEGSDD